MLGLPILDVAIGIAFFYLTFALICTTVNETLARWFTSGPKYLKRPSRSFSEIKKPKKSSSTRSLPGFRGTNPMEKLKLRLISQLPPSQPHWLISSYPAQRQFATRMRWKRGSKPFLPACPASLTALYQKANGNFDVFHDLLETHFNNAMDRASGCKRYVQKQTKVLAVIIVLWADFDTLHVAERLWTDSALRSAIVEDAKARAQARNSGDVPLAVYNSDQPDQGTAVEPGTSPLSDKEETLINSVTGWQRDLNELGVKVKAASEAAESDQKAKDNTVFWIRTQWLLMHLLGWLLSIFAISLGAPFWFDLLNRFMNLRNAGRAPDEPRAKNTSAPTQEATA